MHLREETKNLFYLFIVFLKEKYEFDYIHFKGMELNIEKGKNVMILSSWYTNGKPFLYQ